MMNKINLVNVRCKPHTATPYSIICVMNVHRRCLYSVLAVWDTEHVQTRPGMFGQRVKNAFKLEFCKDRDIVAKACTIALIAAFNKCTFHSHMFLIYLFYIRAWSCSCYDHQHTDNHSTEIIPPRS